MVFCKLRLLKLLVFDADEFNYQRKNSIFLVVSFYFFILTFFLCTRYKHIFSS